MKNRDIPVLLDRLCAAWLQVRPDGRRDMCIGATRLGLHVLRELGVPARAMPVRVAIANEPYLRMLRENEKDLLEADIELTPDVAAHWKREGAWTLKIGYGPDPRAQRPGWDGHLTIAVKNRWLVDLTLDQASRPAKGIHLRPGVLEDPDFIAGRKDATGVSVGSSVVAYMPHDDDSYLRMPDWTRVRPSDQGVRRLLDLLTPIAR